MQRVDRLCLVSAFLLGFGCSSEVAGDGVAPEEAPAPSGATGGSTAHAGASGSGGRAGGGAGGSNQGSGGARAGSGGSSGSAGEPSTDGGSGAGGAAGSGGARPQEGGVAGAGGFSPDGAPPALTPGVWKDVSPQRPAGWDVWFVRVDPTNTATLYAAMCAPSGGSTGGGVWRSRDAGSTWAPYSLPGCATGVAADPKDPLHAYVSYALFSGDKGNFWVTHDGGATWAEKDLTYSRDVGRFVVDPYDFQHIVLAFHYVGDDTAGIIQSTDGGETWARTAVAPWGYGGTKGVHFLSDSKTWLVTTEGGYYRTSDGGQSFTVVASGTVGTHGGNDTTYHASDGSVYVPGYPSPVRSTDNGVTWKAANNGLGNAGYYRVLLGDGHTLYTAPSNYNHIATSPENGEPVWTWGTQALDSGPSTGAFDPVGRILYVGTPGVWALKVVDP